MTQNLVPLLYALTLGFRIFLFFMFDPGQENTAARGFGGQWRLGGVAGFKLGLRLFSAFKTG